MENLPEVRRRIEASRQSMQQAQTERVKAAGTLLKRLSFRDEAPKKSKTNDPDSLPSSPAKISERFVLKERPASTAGPLWKATMRRDSSSSESEAEAEDSQSSSDDHQAKTAVHRRASLLNMLNDAKKSANLGLPKKTKIGSSGSSTPAVSIAEISELPAVVLLKRGQATHRIFTILSNLEIPTNVAWMRTALGIWRKPDPAINLGKIAPLRAWVARKSGALLADAFWRIRTLVYSARKVVKNESGDETVLEFRDKQCQTEARQQYSQLIALGKISRVIDAWNKEQYSDFFTRLKNTRKKQMEIAFLRAVIAELKRREN